MALRVMGQLGLDGSGFFQTMTRADASVKRFSNSLQSGMAARLGALFSVGAIGLALRKTIEYGGKLTDLAARTGVSVEALQRFDAAAKQNGSSLETLISFWEKLNTAREAALKDPKGNQAAAFSRLGVSAGDLRSSSTEDITRKIGVALQNSTNIEELIAPLREVGGRGAGQLVAAFKSGIEAEIAVMTAEQADQLDELGDKWESLMQELSVKLAPAIVWAIDAFKDLWDSLTIGLSVVENFGQAIGSAVVGTFQKIMSGEILNPFKMAKEFGAQFFNASQKAWDDIGEITAAVQAERAEQDAKDAAARAARIASRLRKGDVNFDEVQPKAAKDKFSTPSDSLVRVGNFLGSGNQSAVNAIGEKQLDVQRQILSVAKANAQIMKAIEPALRALGIGVP